MPANSTIILIDDDQDDIEIFRMALESLGVNAPLHTFQHAGEALRVLEKCTEPPGLIICDMRLAGESGMDLRQRIADDGRMHRMAIPFIFMSTSVRPEDVDEAYRLPVQGIFLKSPNFGEFKDNLRRILEYWSQSITPGTTEPSGGWL